MAFPNKFARRCEGCRAMVPVALGHTEGPPWKTFCKDCYAKRPGARPVAHSNYDLRVALLDQGHVTLTLARPMGSRFEAYRLQCMSAGAKFDGVRRCNVVALETAPALIGALDSQGFTFEEVDPDTAMAMVSATRRAAEQEAKSGRRCEDIETRTGAKLYPFQREGVRWLAPRDRALFCDEMGLGKTVQGLAALPELAPVVVVCPAVAKGVWLRECKKWRPDMTPVVLEGKGSFQWPKPGEMVVTNYDILPELVSELPPEGCVLIADEGHALKSAKANRTRRFRALADVVRARGGKTWIFTATPLLNRPPELWALAQAAGLAQKAWGSWSGFLQAFHGKPGPWGGYVWGQPGEDAKDRFATIALRRLKKDVLPDLPAKTYEEVPVTPTREALLKIEGALPPDWEKKLDLVLGEGELGFEQFSRARSALALAKVGALSAMLDDYEEADEPVLVFSAHDAPLRVLGQRKGWAVIAGDTPADERTRIADAFQAGELLGIAGNIQAAGVAITLTRASNVLFLDRAWTPALNWQAEDRACRIGQTRGVLVRILTTTHPLDLRVAELLRKKEKLTKGAVGS